MWNNLNVLRLKIVVYHTELGEYFKMQWLHAVSEFSNKLQRIRIVNTKYPPLNAAAFWLCTANG